MADNYVIDVEVEIDSAAYDDPMDALSHVDEWLNQSDDVTRVEATLKENTNN